MHAGGSGYDAWFVFEPVRPRPRTAPLAVVMHGYGEYAGYNQMYEFIRHTVRKGSVVIYPRWQTNIATPCPGPIDIEPCMKSSLRGIRAGLAYLHARPRRRVQPDLRRTSYFGFSFGGIVTANLTNRWRKLHLPKPRAIWLEDPHDGGLVGIRRARGGRLPARDPVIGEAHLPLERHRASSRSRTRRTAAATRSSRSSATSRSATRTSC